jgi:hypothetical protein
VISSIHSNCFLKYLNEISQRLVRSKFRTSYMLAIPSVSTTQCPVRCGRRWQPHHGWQLGWRRGGKKTDALIHLLLVASDLAVRDGTSPASWCWTAGARRSCLPLCLDAATRRLRVLHLAHRGRSGLQVLVAINGFGIWPVCVPWNTKVPDSTYSMHLSDSRATVILVVLAEGENYSRSHLLQMMLEKGYSSSRVSYARKACMQILLPTTQWYIGS